MGNSSANSTEDVIPLASVRVRLYDIRLTFWVPETPCGQKMLIVSRSQPLVRAECEVQQRSQEKKE